MLDTAAISSSIHDALNRISTTEDSLDGWLLVLEDGAAIRPAFVGRDQDRERDDLRVILAELSSRLTDRNFLADAAAIDRMQALLAESFEGISGEERFTLLTEGLSRVPELFEREPSVIDFLSDISDLHRRLALDQLPLVVERYRRDLGETSLALRAALDTERQPVPVSPHRDIHDVVYRSSRLKRRQMNRAGIQLGIRLESSRVVTPRNLDVCLEEALENAIKYMGQLPPRSRHKATWITIKSVDVDDTVVLSVESWGVPVTVDELKDDLLFDDGYVGHYVERMVGRRVGGGHGLSSMRKDAEAGGFEVRIDSKRPLLRDQEPIFTTTTLYFIIPSSRIELA